MQDIQKLRFAKSHEWIAPDGTVGITDHAQKEVTDVVFVELPPVGKAAAREQSGPLRHRGGGWRPPWESPDPAGRLRQPSRPSPHAARDWAVP